MICWLCAEVESVTLWGCNIWRRKEHTVGGVSGGPPTPHVRPAPVSGQWTRTRSFQLGALMLTGAQPCTWNQIKSQRESPWQRASHSVHQHAQRFGQRSFQKKAKCGGGCICFSTQTKPFWDFLQVPFEAPLPWSMISVFHGSATSSPLCPPGAPCPQLSTVLKQAMVRVCPCIGGDFTASSLWMTHL